MPRTVIEIKGLVKRYDGREPILNGISFSVGEKDFVVICGPSGCGKTTLLNILGGLDRPTSGAVEIDGIDVAGLDEDELARIRLDTIGFVFQDFNLLADLTVRENVALPLRFSRKRNDGRVDSLLERFGIVHIADEQANRISGGEAQRAAIVRAMVNEPRIILADEPTGNLDNDNTAKVIETFRVVREDFNTTVVLATHDNDLVKYATTRIFLDGGEVSISSIVP